MSAMTSLHYHRAVRRVSRWCEWYTRDLDPDLASARRDEIASDLFEQAMWADELGVAPDRLARIVLSRGARGAVSDLSWRHAQRRHALMADPAIGRVRRLNGTALGIVLIAAIGVLTWGVYVLARVAMAVADGTIRAGSETSISLIVFTALASCGVVLLARRRTRVAGALWMVLPSLGLVHFGLVQLYSLSATVGLMLGTMRSGDLATDALMAGLALFFLAAAIWWWPERRKATR
jgi:hypothetical protein